MKLQVLLIKNFLRWTLKKDDNYYLQVFLKGCKYIEKKVIRHINDNLNDFPYSDESNDEQIKAIRLMVFERTILKMYFLKELF